MRSVKWWLIRGISLKRTIIYLRIFEDVHDFLLFLLPARSNTTDFRSVQSFHCDVANVALDSPRRCCGKISEGCTSLFDRIPCRCSQGSDNESWWGTAGHKTKSPVEWTNWLWMNYSGFMFFCWTRNCKSSFPHFPTLFAACSFWIWGYFYIHYQESHIVQWHLCPALRKWTPTVLAMGWACGIDEVGCLHWCGWILQYLGVWRNHLGTGKVPMGFKWDFERTQMTEL